MKTHKVLLLAVIVSAALAVSAEAGKHDGNNNGSQVAPARGRSSAPTIGSGSGVRYGGGRMVTRSQRFQSMGVRSMPTSPRLRGQRSFSSVGSGGGAGIGQRQFTSGTLNSGGSNRLAGLENNRVRNLGTIRNGGGNRTGSIVNGNRVTGAGAGNHVFARRSADFHRDWDRHSDHWWHGHRCRWVNNSWFIFDLGFFPWYGWDYYPYDYYYPNSYYGYDPGVYDQGIDPNYYGQGNYDSSDQGADENVAAAQDRLAREGYYRGQIDGVFGPETRRAILRYQSNHGLGATGYLTMETRQSLGLRQGAGN
jgi:hypothetical protein